MLSVNKDTTMLKKIKSHAEEWVLNHKKKLLAYKHSDKLVICKKCHTFYYKNAWHFDQPFFMNTDSDQEIPVRFTECPACLEQEVALYELESQYQ